MSYTNTFASKTGAINLADLDQAFQETANGAFSQSASYPQGSLGTALQQLMQTASATAISTAISQAIQQNNTVIFAAMADIPADAVGPYTVDGLVFADSQLLATYLAAKASGGGGGGSAPIPNAKPTISDSTVDVTQIVTVSAGTVSSGSVTQYAYRWIVNGTPQSNVWLLGPANAAQAVGGTAPSSAQTLVLEELLYWAGGPYPTGPAVSNKSINYTLNAGAAVPVNQTAPSVTVVGGGSAANPGGQLSVSGGIWTNSPIANGYTYKVYDGGPPSSGGLLMQTLTNQTPPLVFTLTPGTYDGKTLVFGVTASNAQGTSAEAFTSPIQVTGGAAPSNIGKVPVGFSYAASYPVNVAIPLEYKGSDYWTNNPSGTGYSVTFRRNGATISIVANPDTYTPVSADQGQWISYAVTASNGGLVSAPAYAAGVYIVAAVGGGGGGGGGGSGSVSYVGKTVTGNWGNMSVDTLALSNVAPSSPASGDLALIVAGVNEVMANRTFSPAPSGFSTLMAQTDQNDPVGNSNIIWQKVLGSSEPATYSVTLAEDVQSMGSMLVVLRGGTVKATAAAPDIDQTFHGPAAFTVTFPALTKLSANEKMVLVAWLDLDVLLSSASVWQPPSGFSVIAQTDFTGIDPDYQSIVVMLEDANSSDGTAKSAQVTLPNAQAGFMSFAFSVGP